MLRAQLPPAQRVQLPVWPGASVDSFWHSSGRGRVALNNANTHPASAPKPGQLVPVYQYGALGPPAISADQGRPIIKPTSWLRAFHEVFAFIHAVEKSIAQRGGL